MSSMLEQAIIDATALKEAALKNAEAAVVEKYSTEVKDAMKAILEQDELEVAIGQETSDAGDTDSFVDNVPLAATEGEALCQCPEEEEVVVLDFDELVKQMDDEEADVEELSDREEMADELGGDELNIELDDEELEAALMEESVATEEEEEIDIREEDLQEVLDALEEKLTVDIGPELTGWAGRPESDKAHAELQFIAKMQDTEVKKEIEQSEEAVERLKDLMAENAEMKEKLEALTEKNTKLTTAVVALREHVEETSTSNAKLLYTNRVLTSDSLNERQKSKIVEAISNAETVEEAKVIFETLQSTVGSTDKKGPKSLSEAVDRSSTTTLPRTTRHSEKEEPALTRWQLLAGLK